MRSVAARSKIPHFIPQTIPTPPDESDTTGQVFFDSRMIPTSPNQSDHMHPSFNPKVPGSRPGRPTRSFGVFSCSKPKTLSPADGEQASFWASNFHDILRTALRAKNVK